MVGQTRTRGRAWLAGPLLGLCLLQLASNAGSALLAVASSQATRSAPIISLSDAAVCAAMVFAGISSFPKQANTPEEMPWSKFGIGYKFKRPCSAQVGMLIKYIPAFLYAGWMALHGAWPMATLMLLLFGKRIVEVALLHDFTGAPTEELTASVAIAGIYTFQAWIMIKGGLGVSGPLVSIGGILFVIGQAGNLYHHILLRSLRRKPDGKYGKYHVPEGGLFDLVACPHYLFEIVSWASIALLAGTAPAWCVLFCTGGLLTGRSVATTKWYQKRFGADYPAGRRHIVPYLF
mmetsp:Transcript_14418/g.31577  ORF Transcript_14418/g.31577 Transcript_14418/m.31577 type:complete len:291 (-) Transcript_14418:85-957(-)